MARVYQYNQYHDYSISTKEELLFDLSRVEDETYIKGYFGRMESLAFVEIRTPIPLCEAMSDNLQEAVVTFGKTAFSTSLFRTGLLTFVTALVERRYSSNLWMDSVLGFFEEVMGVVIHLIRESKEDEEILRLFLRIFNTRNDIYRSDDRLDYHRILRDQFYSKEYGSPKEGEEKRQDIKQEVKGEGEEKADEEKEGEEEREEEGEGEEKEEKANLELSEQKEEGHMNPYPFVELDPTDIMTSIYYLINVNRFGVLGGYEVIMDRIQSSSQKLPCKQLSLFLKVIDSTKYALKHSFLATLTEKLFSLAHHHILNFTPNEYREQSLEDVMDSLAYLSSLASYAYLTQLVEAIDQFKLEMCLTYIQLPFFDARLKGIEYITSMIASAQGHSSQGAAQKPSTAHHSSYYSNYDPDDWDFETNPLWKNGKAGDTRHHQEYTYFSSRVEGDRARSISSEPDSPPPLLETPDVSKISSSAALISVKYMVQWIEEHGIVEKIFQSEHPEAIRQGTKIIVFVAKESGLSSKLLEAIWAASTLHESLQSVIFKVIIDTLDFLSLPQIDFIFEKISLIPTADYNSHSLVFITDFTRRVMRLRAERNEEEKLYGFDIFWNILNFQSQSGADRYFQAIVAEALEHLERLLLEFEGQKAIFMDRCIHALQSGVNVDISLTLLHKIIETLRYTERGSAILSLEDKSLLDSVLAHLENVSQTKADTKSILGVFEFLKYILTQSPLMMSEEQADRLWESSLRLENPDLAYQWLETVQGMHSNFDPFASGQPARYPAFPVAVTEYLFTQKMAHLNFETASLDVLRMYRRFFLIVNARHKKIQRMGDNEFRVKDFDLVGFEPFWTAALFSRSSDVARTSLAFLRNVYENAPPSHPQVAQRREQFLTRVMDRILSSLRTLTSPADDPSHLFAKEQAVRCVSILHAIIAKENRFRSSRLIHGLATKEAVWRIEFQKAQARKAEQEKEEKRLAELRMESLKSSKEDEEYESALQSSALEQGEGVEGKETFEGSVGGSKGDTLSAGGPHCGLANVGGNALVNVSSEGLVNASSEGLVNLSSDGFVYASTEGLVNLSSEGFVNASSEGIANPENDGSLDASNDGGAHNVSVPATNQVHDEPTSRLPPPPLVAPHPRPCSSDDDEDDADWEVEDIEEYVSYRYPPVPALELPSEISSEDRSHAKPVPPPRTFPMEVTRFEDDGPTNERTSDLLVSRYADTFFDLLAFCELRDMAWDLIMSLPTNAAVLALVRNLPKEEGMFCFAREMERFPQWQWVFRMLYVIQIVRVRLQEDEWVHRFVEADGLSYLVDVFSNQDLLTDASGEYGKQTVSHLVDTMNFLFSSGKVDHERLVRCLSKNFVHRLMRQIGELAVRPHEEKAASVNPLAISEVDCSRSTKQNTRIAICHYGQSKWVASFAITGEHYQVAAYCVDYNTHKRVQTMVAWLGDDPALGKPLPDSSAELVTLEGPAFRNGQWVVWDVHGEGTFNLTLRKKQGANWVLSALLIDPSPNTDALRSVYPTVLRIDSETQGKWRGRYGSLGGILLGCTDYPVPPQPDTPESAPRLISFDTHNCTRFEWAHALVSDPRAMQLPPSEDGMDPLDEAEWGEEEEKEVVRVSVSEEEAKATETGSTLLKMLLSSVLDRDDLVHAILDFPDLGDWIPTCLIQCEDAGLRNAVVEGVFKLCVRDSDCFALFLKKLLDFLPKIEATVAASPALCFTQFFELLYSLLMRTSDLDTKGLFSFALSFLRTHASTEDHDKPDRVDTPLLGFLNILSALFYKDPGLVREVLGENVDFLEFVFHDFLNGVPESRSAPRIPKCQTPASRSSAYSVILSLVEHSPAAHSYCLRYIQQQLVQSEKPTLWSINLLNPQAEEATTEKAQYVGLKNQGCTCYMNSLLQQLYIIPSLRSDVLNVKLSESSGKTIMSELQALFAYLQESTAKFVDPIDFCKTVKMMGEPVVMNRQEDANEFFNALADQVEPFLKGKKQENMFKDTFGGVLVNQILAQECPHQSNNPQDFLTISLKVQSKRDLYESLDFYIQADVLDGNNKWQCEQCERKVTAKKRACLQHLPNTLAIHLIRFEFDYQTFQEVKVNDRFEFPHHLNMKPYTKEGISLAAGEAVDPEWLRPDDYYEYDLVGVLVHAGTAHSGHYYSFIRERVGRDQQEPQWFRFDDKDVTLFNIADIPDQTFGGKFSEDYGGFDDKSYSAYMLFYERKNTYPAGKYCVSPLHMGSVSLNVSQDRAEEEAVEPGILDTIWRDSTARLQRKQFFSAPTSSFIWSVVEATPSFDPVEGYEEVEREEKEMGETEQAMAMGARFLFDYLSHCLDNMDIQKKFPLLSALFRKHAPMSAWFLRRVVGPNNMWLKDVVLSCPDSDIRTCAADFVSSCISAVAPYEATFYSERVVVRDAFSQDDADANLNDSDDNGVQTQPRSLVVRVVNYVSSLLQAAADKPSQRIEQLLCILLNFARLGLEERRFLAEKNAISDLISLFDSHRMTLAYQVSTPIFAQRFTTIFEIVTLLICSSDNPAQLVNEGYDVPPPTGIPFPDETILRKIFDRSFLTNLMRQPNLVPLVSQILVHWLWGRYEASMYAVKSICGILDTQYTPQTREPYITLLVALMQMEDPSALMRVPFIMTQLVHYLGTNAKAEGFRSCFCDLVMNFCRDYPAARESIVSRTDLFNVMERWEEVRKALVDRHGQLLQEILDEYHARYPEDDKEEEGDDDDDDDVADEDDEDDDEEYIPRPRVKF